jgi:uncharacterized DUF497 family protein
VRCVFDPVKDATNRTKHGVSMADDRFHYGEVREVAFGVINGRLFACVYADRNGSGG